MVSDIAMHYYALAQTTKQKPRVCLLPTPSGDNAEVIRTFYGAFSRHNVELNYLSMFHNNHPADKHREFILSQDMIMVCGGQSKTALGIFREWGLDIILRDAYDAGVVLCGGSAGAVIFSNSSLTDSYGDLRPMPFLDFLPGSMCPHYRAKERRVAYRSAILERRIQPGYGIGDGAALHFIDGNPYRAVSSTKEASVFYVDIDKSGKEEKVESKRLPISYLHDREVQDELIWGAACFNLENEPASETVKVAVEATV